MHTELVTKLKRKATDATQPAEDQKPILITQHGFPASSLGDVDRFSSMQKKITLLEGIARGEKAILGGRILSHADAKKRMSRWLA